MKVLYHWKQQEINRVPGTLMRNGQRNQEVSI